MFLRNKIKNYLIRVCVYEGVTSWEMLAIPHYYQRIILIYMKMNWFSSRYLISIKIKFIVEADQSANV